MQQSSDDGGRQTDWNSEDGGQDSSAMVTHEQDDKYSDMKRRMKIQYKIQSVKESQQQTLLLGALIYSQYCISLVT